MRSFGVSFAVAMLMLAASWLLPVPAFAGAVAPKGPLNTLADIGKALRGCWQWPPISEAHSGMDLTVRLSFKRDGEIFGVRIIYQTRDVAPEERALYHGALLLALRLCSPLPLSPGLGAAIAGKPMTFRFHDTRQQRKA